MDVNENGGPLIDYTTLDWMRIEERLRDVLEDSEAIVMSPQVPEREADFHRGQASLIKRMLDWKPQAGR